MPTMTRTRLLSASLVALFGLTACEGLKEAMTAHVDTVARAGSQELTVTRLAELLGPTDVPLRADAVRSVAQLWVNYQLLGAAAAAGDSLATDAQAEDGMWSAIAQIKSRKYFEVVAKDWGIADSSKWEQAYNDGAVLGASHILLTKQPEGLDPAQNAAIKAEAEKLAASLKGASLERFGAVARERTQDPGSKDRGGDYGVFPPGQMVPEFDAGIRSVAPGAVSGVVETQFGYHIIRRHTYAEIKDQFAEVYGQVAGEGKEQEYFEGLEKAQNVQVKAAAAKLVKAIAEDVDAYRDDKTVIASARNGDMTAGRMARWMAAFPPQTRMRAQVAQAPDSLIPLFVKNVMRNELLLRAADSAGVTVDSTEMAEVRGAFRQAVLGVMDAMGLAPQALADSAPDKAARERLAASRVEEYLSGVVKNERQYIEVPEQIAIVLRAKYESRLVPAGVDRVLAEATKLRAAADSARAATQPPSAVPLGGPTGAPVPPAPQPQP